MQWVHLFGRGRKISEPLCSSPELTLMAGMNCHMQLDAYALPERLEELRWQAVARVLAKHAMMPPFEVPDEQWTATRAMRYLEESLR